MAIRLSLDGNAYQMPEQGLVSSFPDGRISVLASDLALLDLSDAFFVAFDLLLAFSYSDTWASVSRDLVNIVMPSFWRKGGVINEAMNIDYNCTSKKINWFHTKAQGSTANCDIAMPNPFSMGSNLRGIASWDAVNGLKFSISYNGAAALSNSNNNADALAVPRLDSSTRICIDDSYTYNNYDADYHTGCIHRHFAIGTGTPTAGQVTEWLDYAIVTPANNQAVYRFDLIKEITATLLQG